MEEKKTSIRNLQDGFVGTPLRRFYGKLESYASEPATGYEGTRINLNFLDIEVIQSTEPYNFPTAVINIGVSNKKKSKWGYFGASMAELVPDEEDLENQVGRKIGLVFCDGQEGRPEPKPIWNSNADRVEFPNGEVPTPVWIVFEVEGVVAGAATTSSAEQAKKLLDGKTITEFNKAAYSDPLIRKDTELQRSITDKSFVKAMLAAGEFTKDSNDLYHRVKK